MKWLTLILFIVVIISCDSSDDESIVSEPFQIESSVNRAMLDGYIKNDEFIEVRFEIESGFNKLSHLEGKWTYISESSRIDSVNFRINKQNFSLIDETYKYTYSIPESSIYNILSSPDSLKDDDHFILDWIAYAMDSSELAVDQSEIKIDIECSIDSEFLMGNYALRSQLQCQIFGCDFSHYIRHDTVNIKAGNSQMSRVFEAIYLDSFGILIELEFACNGIFVPRQDIGVGCGPEGIIFKSESINTNDLVNDDVVTIDFVVDLEGTCGFTDNESLTLSKIN